MTLGRAGRTDAKDLVERRSACFAEAVRYADPAGSEPARTEFEGGQVEAGMGRRDEGGSQEEARSRRRKVRTEDGAIRRPRRRSCGPGGPARRRLRGDVLEQTPGSANLHDFARELRQSGCSARPGNRLAAAIAFHLVAAGPGEGRPGNETGVLRPPRSTRPSRHAADVRRADDGARDARRIGLPPIKGTPAIVTRLVADAS